MKGFDPKWRDPEHYILGITKDIWEDRGIETLLRYYGPDLIVRSPASVIKGNQGIIAATMATLAEFPDRELLGEDVIWTDAPDGFLSSHRLICTAAHSHPGAYGAPTGRKAAYRIMADCYCAKNAVQDEWLVRDQSAIVTQLGFDVVDWTRAQIMREGGPELCVKPYTPALDMAGPYTGRGNDSEWGAHLSEMLHRVMSGDFQAMSETYDRAVQLHHPSGQDSFGHAAAQQFWLSLRSNFPSATFQTDHVMGQNTKHMPPRAAIRWSLRGTHDGPGMFGPATGAEVFIMGITHAEFGPNGICRDYTLIDETAIWRQILLSTGAI